MKFASDTVGYCTLDVTNTGRRTLMMLCSKHNKPNGVGVRLRRASLTLSGRPVLTSVDWVIKSNEAWVVRGANGAGKTQLLRLLVGERWLDPDGVGQRVYVDAKGRERPLSAIRSRLLWVGGEAIDRYERYQWNFTVRRVVESGVSFSVRPLARLSREQTTWVRTVLEHFGLWQLRSARLLDLSYGQRRWVLLARAFASDAALIALDEIYNGLDETLRAALNRLLPLWQARGSTLLMALHHVDPNPEHITHQVVVRRGRVHVRQTPRSGRSPTPGLSARAGRLQPRSSRPALDRGDEAPVIDLQNASVFRGYKAVLHQVTLRVRPREHCLVVGANGCGKSTLLEAIFGSIPVAFGGVITRLGHRAGQPLRAWQANVGFVSPSLHTDLSLGERIIDVLVSAKRRATSWDQPVTAYERRRARSVLAEFGLTVELEAPASTLSYGQRRLLLLARAWLQRPRLLLLDEPFTGLDQTHREHLARLLVALMRTRTTIIMSVHHLQDAPEGFKQLVNLNDVSRSKKIGPIGF